MVVGGRAVATVGRALPPRPHSPGRIGCTTRPYPRCVADEPSQRGPAGEPGGRRQGRNRRTGGAWEGGRRSNWPQRRVAGPCGWRQTEAQHQRLPGGGPGRDRGPKQPVLLVELEAMRMRHAAKARGPGYPESLQWPPPPGQSLWRIDRCGRTTDPARKGTLSANGQGPGGHTGVAVAFGRPLGVVVWIVAVGGGTRIGGTVTRAGSPKGVTSPFVQLITGAGTGRAPPDPRPDGIVPQMEPASMYL